MRNRKLAAVMAAVVTTGPSGLALLGTQTSASAQVTISVNTTFNPQPNIGTSNFSGSIRPADGRSYITAGSLQRGLAYIPSTATTPARIAVVNRSGAPSINLINPFTGADEGTLNVDPAIVTGGTFALNQIAATSDGVIYAANLVNPLGGSNGPFKVYRWSSISAAPTLYYSGTADQANPNVTGRFGNGTVTNQGNPIRIGDSIAITPGPDGNGGRLGFGWGNSTTGLNTTFTTIPTGVLPLATSPTTPAYAVVTSASSPYRPGVDNSEFRLGFTFSSQTTVFMRGTASGNSTLYYGTVSNGSSPIGNYNAGPDSAFPSTTGPTSAAIPIAYLSANGNDLLATVDLNANYAYVVGVDSTGNTTFLDRARVIPDANGQNGNQTGAVAWGQVTNASTGRTVPLWTLNTNSGISAFTVAVPANSVYAVDGDASYGATNSWSTGVVPNIVGDVATFGSAITANRTVTLASNSAVGRVVFNNANSYTIAGTSTLRLQSVNTSAASGNIVVSQGNHSITAPIVLGNNISQVTVAATSTLSVATVSAPSTAQLIVSGDGRLRVTGLLDVGILNFGGSTTSVNLAPGAVARFSSTAGTGAFADGFSRVVGQVRQPGSAGIKVAPTDVSASAPYAVAVVLNTDPKRPGQTFFSSLRGLPLATTDTLAVTTYLGDTNLDGVINGTDLANIIEGLSTAGATGWLNGDLDLNGSVTLTDLGLFNTAFTAYQANPIPLVGIGLEISGAVTGAVPEPAGLALVPMAAAAMLRRRRK